MQAGWLAGWQASRLADWLAGWQICRQAGRPLAPCWQAGRKAGRPLAPGDGRPGGWDAGRTTGASRTASCAWAYLAPIVPACPARFPCPPCSSLKPRGDCALVGSNHQFEGGGTDLAWGWRGERTREEVKPPPGSARCVPEISMEDHPGAARGRTCFVGRSDCNQ